MERIPVSEVSNKAGQEVKISGWVHSRRDHGKIIFIDLRDKTGLIQVVFAPDNPEAYKSAQSLRPEFVVSITGQVNQRPEKMVNEKIATGQVEIVATKLEILNEAKTTPFEIDQDSIRVNEETRLKYRYLDLRTERMARNMKIRSQVLLFFRNYLNGEGFTEIQTPILSKSSPEGARDYLVPSRIHPGKFFALPQAPQQYKQLLMVAGIEKYFQIAPCFRDEDARADRSPGEFYQLDMEMSFITQDDILNLVEKMFTALVKDQFSDKKITQEPWPRLKYNDVMAKYGTDKPDLRKDKTDPNELAFVWVVDFPLFVPQSEKDFFHGSGSAKFAPSHHMFTAPKDEDVKLLDSAPIKAKSYQHDLVLNGYEVGGGSIRIHNPKIQRKIFDLIGFSDEQKKQFAHLLEAFEYGAPPHGGIAPGIDRLLMVLTGEPSLREFIAFPLTGDARDPMMGAPVEVTEQQLADVHINVREEDLKDKQVKKEQK
ncbi:MAG TPA: aspartate--tRNA ligase [Patescibacteria group bacterium]|nr:aspartate--tRNA ligase [Patescibacteria group bacterium]